MLRVVLFSVVLVAGTVHAATVGEREPFKPFALKTLDGESRTLAQVLGPKATLVVFFFPTCKFCNQALPEVQKLHVAYKDKGLSVVFVNAVPREERLIADWRTTHGYTVPILVGASIRALDKDYKVKLTPTHYLLDAQGRIIVSHGGYKAGDEMALERQIQQALES